MEFLLFLFLHRKKCIPNPALLKILPWRAGKSELCQKQKRSCKYYVWPRPSFCCCFLHSGPFLLNSAGKLACGDSVLEIWGMCLQGLEPQPSEVILCGPLNKWQRKKKTVLLSINIPWLMIVFFISSCPECLQICSESNTGCNTNPWGKHFIFHTVVKSVLRSTFSSLLCIEQ